MKVIRVHSRLTAREDISSQSTLRKCRLRSRTNIRLLLAQIFKMSTMVMDILFKTLLSLKTGLLQSENISPYVPVQYRN